MTSGAVDALRADRDALVEIGGGLDDGEWRSTSGWAGWSVQGLVSHMAGGFWRIVDRSVLPDTTGLPLADAQDRIVAERSTWSPDQVLDDYASVSERALDVFADLDGRDDPISFGELGTHPISMVANSIAFDHFSHIRADLCAPRGPLGATPPPADELRLVPALDWIGSALPQQNAALIASMPGALALEVDGIGARTLTVGSGAVAASVTSDAAAFIGWVTQRWSWADLDVLVAGDPAVLDLARQLSVS